MLDSFLSKYSGFIAPVSLYELFQIPLLVGLLILAFAKPSLGARMFERFEKALSDLASRPMLASLSIVVIAVVGRALLIPVMGVGRPIAPDDSSIILQAQTYLAGRLANPAVTRNFESIYSLATPTYASMYPPLRALPLVVGAALGLGLWGGVWLFMVVLSVAVFGILRLWVKPAYALIAAYITVIRLGLFSFWVNSFFSPVLTALAALILIGAYAAIRRKPTILNGAALGLGAALLMTTRPFEGMLFAAPIALFLLVDFFRAGLGDKKALAVAGAAAGLFVIAGFALILLCDKAITGDWKTTPYDLYRQQSASVPAFFFGKRSDPAQSTIAYPQLRNSLHLEEKSYARRAPASKLFGAEGHRFLNYWNTYIGGALFIPFVIGAIALRRQYALICALGALFIGLLAVTWDHSQYASPAFGVILLFIICGLRELRRWRPRGKPVGLAMSRYLPLALMFGSVLLPLSSALTNVPPLTFGLVDVANNACCWIMPPTIHNAIADRLTAEPGDHIVVVDSGPTASPWPTIVFNDAILDKQKIIWIHDDPALNAATLAAYPGRKHWWLRRAGYTSCFQPYEQRNDPATPCMAGIPDK